MRIRPAISDDIEALADLHLVVWDEVYRDLVPPSVIEERRTKRQTLVDFWRTTIADVASTVLVAQDESQAEDDGERMEGFILVTPARDDDTPNLPGREIVALYVREAIYGRGVGCSLLRAALSDAAYLWVLNGNSRAIAFYERQGFRFDGATRVEPVGLLHRMIR